MSFSIMQMSLSVTEKFCSAHEGSRVNLHVERNKKHCSDSLSTCSSSVPH